MVPASLHAFVPAGHPAHFVRTAMVLALRLSGYSRSVDSSCRLPQACEQHVDFMVTTRLKPAGLPHHQECRKQHIAALAGLFRQPLKLCPAAGLVKLGHVAPDGAKSEANASRQEAPLRAPEGIRAAAHGREAGVDRAPRPRTRARIANRAVRIAAGGRAPT